MKVVELSEKDPYRRQFEHGLVLRSEIQWFYEFYSQFMKKTFGSLMGSIRSTVAQKILTKKFKIPDIYLEEMRGLADGAKVPLAFIRLINTIDDIKSVYGCSSLAVKNPEDWIFGSNLDYAVWAEEICPKVTLFVYHQSNGQPFISLAFPGYIGALRGMNAQGIVLCGHYSHSWLENGKGVPAGLLYRAALEYGEDLDRSERIILHNPRTIGNSILIGNKAFANVIEVDGGSSMIRFPENQKFLTCVNHFQDFEMRKKQRSRFISPGSKLPSFYFSKEYSVRRDNFLRQAVKEKKEFDIPVLHQILKSPEMVRAEIDNLGSTGNLAAIFFNPASLEFWVADNKGKIPAAEGDLIYFNFKNMLEIKNT